MPDHPADVRRGPEDVPRRDPVDVRHGPGERHEIAGGRAHHPLRLAGRARGVEDVERVHPADRHAGRRCHARLRRVPLDVARPELGRALLALQHQHELGLVRRHLDRRVDERLVGDDPARLEAAGGGDHRLRPGIVDPDRELGRGEPAEHHRMDRPEPGAGEHRDERLGHHRHVDDDAVALRHPARRQRARQHCHPVAQLGVGQRGDRAGHRRVVDDRHPLAVTALDVTVDRVPAGVADPVRIPAEDRSAAVVQRPGRRLDPVDARGGPHPEPLGVGLPAGVNVRVFAHAVSPICQPEAGFTLSGLASGARTHLDAEPGESRASVVPCPCSIPLACSRRCRRAGTR